MLAIGQRVNRIEVRETVGATVADYDESADSYLIDYDEGGEGWWPESALEATGE